MDAKKELAARQQDPTGVFYFSYAIMFVSGVFELIHRDDIPFGILQVTTPVACMVVLLSRRRSASKRIATRGLLVVMGCAGVAEIVTGHRIKGVLY